MGTIIPSVSTNSRGEDANQAMKSATLEGGRAIVGDVCSTSLSPRSSGEKAPQLVAMAPGYITMARIPWGRPSSASALVRPKRSPSPSFPPPRRR